MPMRNLFENIDIENERKGSDEAVHVYVLDAFACNLCSLWDLGLFVWFGLGI